MNKNSVQCCYTYFLTVPYRALHIQGGGRAGVLPVLQVPDNAVDAIPCEQLTNYPAVNMINDLGPTRNFD